MTGDDLQAGRGSSNVGCHLKLVLRTEMEPAGQLRCLSSAGTYLRYMQVVGNDVAAGGELAQRARAKRKEIVRKNVAGRGSETV